LLSEGKSAPFLLEIEKRILSPKILLLTNFHLLRLEIKSLKCSQHKILRPLLFLSFASGKG